MITLAVQHMTCAACPGTVKASLQAVPGVTNVVVSAEDKTAVVTYDDRMTRPLLSSKSKLWAIQNRAKISISTQRIFMWTNPLLNKRLSAVWNRNRRFVYSDLRFAQNMGVSSAVETTIPEGTKREINGFVVVPLDIDNPSGGPEANKYSFDLVYDTWSTDEHEANGPGGSFFFIYALGESLFGGPKLASKNVDLIKTNASETTWSVADNCKALSFK
jgi:copper chaperone CopZ